MSAQTTTFVGTFSLIVNIVVVLGIYWLYRQNKKSVEKLNQDQNEIIIKAQKQAQQILTDARKKAQEIISQSEYFKQDLIKSVEESFQEVADKDLTLLENKSDEINQFYKKLLESITNKHLKRTEDTLKAIDSIVNAELNDFREVLKNETVQSEDVVMKRVNEEYLKVKAEIDAYRQTKLSEVDQMVNRMILQISTDVLGKALSVQEHKKLIQDSVDKAIQEGVLTPVPKK
jgi:F0F1-type ATP synthase membrane subunit b/b'